jgi:hypothetical protein
MRMLLRPLFLGIFLIPFCVYWAQDQGIDRIFSLMVPPLAITMVIAALNAPLRRKLPKLALSGPELAVLYAMLATACAMAGEWMDMIVPQVYGYAIYAQNNPRFEKILPFLSDWFFFKDPKVLNDFAQGREASFWPQLALWLPKAGAWTLLLTLICTTMLCINAILKDQWIHREKLAFPLVQLPLVVSEGMDGKNPLFREKLFWGAFFAVFLIDMLNGLSFLYPALPRLNIRFLADMNSWFSAPPWNQTGWTPIGVFPYLAALGFLMPTDLLFSLLFFFVVRKGQQLVSYSLGNEQGVFGGGGLVPSAPYFSEQSWGAFLGLFASAMWLARPHLKQVWEDIWSGHREPGQLSHRFLFLLLLACLIAIGLIGVGIGLPFVFVIFYVGIFLIFSIAVTRLRAALGAPTHEMAFMGPHQLVLDFHGAAGLSPDLVTRTMSTFHFMNRLHRTHPMPTQMEGLYLAEKTGLSGRAMFGALFLATVLGSFGGFIAHVWLGYRWTPVSWISSEVSGVVNSITSTPRPPNPTAMGAVGAGFLVVLALDFIRFRVPGFWLHPAGYALAMNFGVDYYWFGLLVVLLVKVFVQKFYGLTGSDKLRQVAFGLVLGEFTAELLWALFSMLNDRQATYSISINGKLGWNQ